MSRIGRLKFLIEFVFFMVLVQFTNYSFEVQVKLCFLYFLMQFLIGRYQGKVLLFWDELKLLILSHLGFFLGSFMIFPIESWTLRKFFGILYFVVILFLFTILNSRYSHKIFRKYYKKNTLIIGIGTHANKLAHICKTNSYSLIDVIGFVDCNDSEFTPHIHQNQIVDKNKTIRIENMVSFIKEHHIDTALIAVPSMNQEDLNEIFELLRNRVHSVKYLPQVRGLVTFDSQIEDFDGQLMISSSRGVMQFFSKFLKRCLDILGSLAGMLLLFPLTIFVWIKNREQGDHGPIFFTQERIGKDGKPFKIYKYRTMILNADEELERMMNEDPKIREEYAKNKKLAEDPRITKAGKFLREKSLDEFPQFINVLKGEMSMIGPRPYLYREKNDMGRYFDDIVSCKPGLTGMWQTHGRSDVDFDERLKLDEYYYRNWSFWLDITLLTKTVRQVLHGQGAM